MHLAAKHNVMPNMHGQMPSEAEYNDAVRITWFCAGCMLMALVVAVVISL